MANIVRGGLVGPTGFQARQQAQQQLSQGMGNFANMMARKRALQEQKRQFNIADIQNKYSALVQANAGSELEAMLTNPVLAKRFYTNAMGDPEEAMEFVDKRLSVYDEKGFLKDPNETNLTPQDRWAYELRITPPRMPKEPTTTTETTTERFYKDVVDNSESDPTPTPTPKPEPEPTPEPRDTTPSLTTDKPVSERTPQDEQTSIQQGSPDQETKEPLKVFETGTGAVGITLENGIPVIDEEASGLSYEASGKSREQVAEENWAVPDAEEVNKLSVADPDEAVLKAFGDKTSAQVYNGIVEQLNAGWRNLRKKAQSGEQLTPQEEQLYRIGQTEGMYPGEAILYHYSQPILADRKKGGGPVSPQTTAPLFELLRYGVGGTESPLSTLDSILKSKSRAGKEEYLYNLSLIGVENYLNPKQKEYEESLRVRSGHPTRETPEAGFAALRGGVQASERAIPTEIRRATRDQTGTTGRPVERAFRLFQGEEPEPDNRLRLPSGDPLIRDDEGNIRLRPKEEERGGGLREIFRGDDGDDTQPTPTEEEREREGGGLRELFRGRKDTESKARDTSPFAIGRPIKESKFTSTMESLTKAGDSPYSAISKSASETINKAVSSIGKVITDSENFSSIPMADIKKAKNDTKKAGRAGQVLAREVVTTKTTTKPPNEQDIRWLDRAWNDTAWLGSYSALYGGGQAIIDRVRQLGERDVAKELARDPHYQEQQQQMYDLEVAKLESDVQKSYWSAKKAEIDAEKSRIIANLEKELTGPKLELAKSNADTAFNNAKASLLRLLAANSPSSEALVGLADMYTTSIATLSDTAKTASGARKKEAEEMLGEMIQNLGQTLKTLSGGYGVDYLELLKDAEKRGLFRGRIRGEYTDAQYGASGEDIPGTPTPEETDIEDTLNPDIMSDWDRFLDELP